MMKDNLLKILLILLVGILPTSISAQSKWVSPDYVIGGNPFLLSKNPGGLFWIDDSNLSQIDLSFNKINGGLVNYDQSDDAFKTSINATSIYHFNQKIILRGGIDYTWHSGNNASGSMFLHPEQNALDICEFDDEFKGKKVLEQYHILGEIGYNVWKGLILGASFDFTSANFSKMKDLRHSNTYSNINFDFSTTYRFNDFISLGLTYHHIKRIEGIYFKQYSPTERRHVVLVSYGPFWGKRKTYEDNVGMISHDRIPMHDTYDGGSLQLELNPSSNFKLFLEGGIRTRKGSLGIKSPGTIMYNGYEGLDYDATLTTVIHHSNNRHLIQLGMMTTTSETEESIYQQKTTEAGTGYIEYYDPIKVADQSWSHYHLGYRADLGIKEKMPAYTIKLEAEFQNRHKKGILYPYYRDENLWFCQLSSQFKGNFIYGKKNLFSAGLFLSYLDGLHEGLVDGSYIPDATQIGAKESVMMRGREIEYLMNSQLLVNPSFRYARKLKKIDAFAEIDYTYRRSLEKVEFLTSPDQHNILLTLGIIL